MKRLLSCALCVLTLAPLPHSAWTQVPPDAAPPAGPSPPAGDVGPVPLEWVPQALTQLSTEASSRSSFTLDRSMLSAAAGLISGSDQETKQAINKLDGVSVHILQFSAPGTADPALVDSIRQAYHLRGWKHLVTSSGGGGGPVRSGTTDVWLVLDGTNVRGAVLLIEGSKTVTLASLAGNLSPIDLMHLRGHFGIPRFDGDHLKDQPMN
jgi:hypothetical protein